MTKGRNDLNNLFACFGPFHVRFRMLYDASGEIRNLIEKQDYSEEWTNKLQEQIEKVRDAIVIL